MTSEHEQEYDESLQALLEAVWGEGYLSPGGPDEVAKVVEGVDLKAKTILDIGCGTGGIDIFLAEKFEPAKIVGIDVDEGLVNRCKTAATGKSLNDVLEFRAIEPGSLPFDSESFDIVFSKDSIIHIEDKHAIFADIYRVLKPGGVFCASDWLRNNDEPMSDELSYYVEMEDLGFGMASPQRYDEAMRAAGFVDVTITNRNEWYRALAKQEHKSLSGELYDGLCKRIGKDFLDHEVEVWRAMTVVLDSDELRPSHIRAFKV
ncbi:MAG: methyltransferase domain-containing protein [Gammaproteobacteria bacterium]|nr:methyltransferase domain-containing protein [Gammaproteobacteria bacterium]